MLLPPPVPTPFTPVLALAGGLMIGASAGLLWIGIGRIAGISGIAGGLIERAERDWRLAFVFGLLLAGLFARMLGIAPTIHLSGSVPLLAFAGLLVGCGTALGGGCTSGHGICGLSRAAPRSIVATLVFMVVAATVVFFTRTFGGS
ncbi:YeeE/YedE family protein [Acidiphilium sp. AL]|uniref:YeeE/YedE family protein n=1 Tax=Acidiphilium iwatense TaxID=768198 RepID=A0ABS9DY97_9PROT|nr:MULTISPECIES: YeeE/YedE family protein [Acidiphilium]MCF3947088.1 YeeE/YedE family protein [Acidiphilium iwatense]MCU4160490.1 YeeE/YedE family protein [Acidiphilium sp. AL]